MNWSEIFLGVIALATLVMAFIQVGAAVAIARTSRQAQQVLTSLVDTGQLVLRGNTFLRTP